MDVQINEIKIPLQDPVETESSKHLMSVPTTSETTPITDCQIDKPVRTELPNNTPDITIDSTSTFSIENSMLKTEKEPETQVAEENSEDSLKELDFKLNDKSNDESVQNPVETLSSKDLMPN